MAGVGPTAEGAGGPGARPGQVLTVWGRSRTQTTATDRPRALSDRPSPLPWHSAESQRRSDLPDCHAWVAMDDLSSPPQKPRLQGPGASAGVAGREGWGRGLVEVSRNSGWPWRPVSCHARSSVPATSCSTRSVETPRRRRPAGAGSRRSPSRAAQPPGEGRLPGRGPDGGPGRPARHSGPPSARSLGPPTPSCSCAEGIEKPGNLGSMLRSAESPGCTVIAVDPVTDRGNPTSSGEARGGVCRAVATTTCDRARPVVGAAAYDWWRRRPTRQPSTPPRTDLTGGSRSLSGPRGTD